MDAASQGARLIILPECFNSPYSTSSFPEYAEAIPDPGQTVDVSAHATLGNVAQWARETGAYIVAGSIPERCSQGKLYNTSTVFDPRGELIAKHRKVHLFDIDIPGKVGI